MATLSGVVLSGSGGNAVAGSDTITVTVTGPASYSKAYSAAAVGGGATFNLGGAALTTAGSYSYSAAIVPLPAVIPVTAAETVLVGAPATVTISAGSGQSAMIDAAFAAPFVATVTDAFGNPVSGATVQFAAPASGFSAVLSAASGITNSSGVASVTAVANGTAGTYMVIASAGSATPGSFTLTNSQATPAVQLTTSTASALAGTAITFTAQISSTAGSPTGSVTFLDGVTSIGSVALSGSSAALTLSTLGAGIHSVTAVYSGDADFISVTSTPVMASVLDFVLSASPTASPTLAIGQPVTYTFAIQPTSGATLPVITTLTITGLPSGATATLSLSSWTATSSTSWTLPAGSTFAPIPLVVTAPTTLIAANHERGRGGWPPVALGLLLVPLAWRMRRARRVFGRSASWMVLAVAAILAASALSGCGSGYGFFGNQSSSYSLTVTATAGTLTHLTNVTLTVQ